MAKYNNINVRTAKFFRWTPLHYAAAYGKVETVKYLLKNYPRIEVNARAFGGSTPLNLAISELSLTTPTTEQRIEVARLLVKHGAKQYKGKENKYPFELPFAKKNKEIQDIISKSKIYSPK